MAAGPTPAIDAPDRDPLAIFAPDMAADVAPVRGSFASLVPLAASQLAIPRFSADPAGLLGNPVVAPANLVEQGADMGADGDLPARGKLAPLAKDDPAAPIQQLAAPLQSQVPAKSDENALPPVASRAFGGISGGFTALVVEAPNTQERSFSADVVNMVGAAIPAALRDAAPGTRAPLADVLPMPVAENVAEPASLVKPETQSLSAPTPLSAEPLRLAVVAGSAAPVPMPAPAQIAAPAAPAAAPAGSRGAVPRAAGPASARVAAAPALQPAQARSPVMASAAPSAAAARSIALSAPVPAAMAPAASPAPAAAAAAVVAVVPRPKEPQPTAPGLGPVGTAASAYPLDIKSQLVTRVDGKTAGAVDFQQTPNGIKVRLGAIAEVLVDRYDPAVIARIRGSAAGQAYLSLAELQAQGIPISYDPVYDEFNVGLTDTRPKAARKVHIDQISAPERGGGSTGIEQVRP
jgi:hypothetical protein